MLKCIFDQRIVLENVRFVSNVLLWSLQVSGNNDSVVPYYDPAEVVTAWSMLLNASVCNPALLTQQTFLTDLVSFTVQVCVIILPPGT